MDCAILVCLGCGLVNNCFGWAFFFWRTVGLVSAIAFLFIGGFVVFIGFGCFGVHDSFVVVVNCGFHVGRAAVAWFSGVSVECFVEFLIFGGVFVNWICELFAWIGVDIFIVGRVEMCCFSFSGFLLWFGCLGYWFVFGPIFVWCFLISIFNFVGFFFITRGFTWSFVCHFGDLRFI